MTEKELSKFGFYKVNSGTYWHRNSSLSGINFYIDSLTSLEAIMDQVISKSIEVGIELGKDLKAKEVRDALNI